MRPVFLLISLVLLLREFPAAGAVPEFEAGQQTGFRFGDPDASSWTRKRFYLSAKHELLWEAGEGPSSFALNGFVRTWGEMESGSNGSKIELDVRGLSAVWNSQVFRSELGFQEVPWGETFGFFIADLVNPRDYGDALFNEPAWTRLSVFAWNTQFFLQKLTLQFVFTPLARFNRFPEPVMNRKALSWSDFPSSAEYGARASYLFESGLDLGWIYYRHWNRNPALSVPAERVQSLGMTASQSAGEWVLRADSVVHLGQSGIPNNWQLIVGADRSQGESLTWGAQYHLDRESQVRHWLSGMARFSGTGRRLEAEIFLFRGLDNADFWIQPKLTWNITDAVAWSGRLDLLPSEQVPGEGVLWRLVRQDRFFSWLSFRF